MLTSLQYTKYNTIKKVSFLTVDTNILQHTLQKY